MKILLCLIGIALFVGVSAFPRPTSNVPSQCVDPTFACQDLANARLCGVVKDCINDIWSTMGVPDSDDNDEVCDICKEMVKEARDQLLSNMTQEEIKEVFEGSCKLLPVKLVADACIKLVDEFIPELVEMLASRMDPTTVCTVSGMCFVSHSSSETAFFKYVKMIMDSKKADECQQCTTMVKDLQTFLKTSTEDEDKKFIENICSKEIPSYLCDMFVNEYFHTFYSYIISTDAATMCSAAGACPQKKCEVNDDRVNDELTCEFCDHVLHHVKDLITANTTVEEFRTALLNFCKHVGSFSEKCTSLVNDYYDMLFDYIRKMDTRGMCTLIGLCDNVACNQVPLVKLVPAVEAKNRIPMMKLRPANQIPMMKLRPANQIPMMKLRPANQIVQNVIPMVKLVPASVASKKQMVESNDIFQLNVKVMQSQSKDGPFCELCKDAMTQVENVLGDPKTKQQIENMIDQACNMLPESLRDECDDFLNSQVDALISILQQELQPDNICPALKLCDASKRIQVSKNVKDLECDICKDVVTNLRQKLSDPEAKKVVLVFLEEGCARLPGSLSQECRTFVDENIDTLLGMIIQELDPDSVCSILKICPSTLIKEEPKKFKDVECDLCKEVVKKVEDLISEKKTEEEIQAALDKVCSYLPSSWAAKCTNFVDQYTQLLITLIMEEMDPSLICAAMNVCPETLKKEIPKKVKDAECDLCKEVIAKVEEMISDQKTEAEIQAALDKVCSLLPSSWGAKCKTFVDTYTKTIITLITNEMDPDMVCAAMNVCPTQDLECEACQYLLHYIQEQLSTPDSQAEVKNFLKKVCSLLPESLDKNCEAFVDEYGDALLVLLAQEIDPTKMCFQVQMCSNETRIFEPTNILHPFNTDECSVCTTVVDYIDKLLEEDDVDKEITKLIEKVCTILPASYIDKCSTILDSYGPYILQMIGQLDDSKQVCQDIDLCPRPSGKVHLIGGSKCTFGPSYWCQSAAHASACKAEKFCTEKVWKN